MLDTIMCVCLLYMYSVQYIQYTVYFKLVDVKTKQNYFADAIEFYFIGNSLKFSNWLKSNSSLLEIYWQLLL